MFLAIPKVNLDKCLFGIQFHRLPLEAFSVRNTLKLGETMGLLYEVEDPWVNGVVAWSCLRDMLFVDIRKSLMGVALAKPIRKMIFIKEEGSSKKEGCKRVARDRDEVYKGSGGFHAPTRWT